MKESTDTYLNSGTIFSDPKDAQSKAVRLEHSEIAHSRDAQSNKSAAAKLKEMLKAKAKGTAAPGTETTDESASASGVESPVQLGKRKVDDMEDDDNGTPGRNTPFVPESPSPSTPKKEDGTPEDAVKLGEDGYEERYYEQKFKAAPNDIVYRNKVARQ